MRRFRFFFVLKSVDGFELTVRFTLFCRKTLHLNSSESRKRKRHRLFLLLYLNSLERGADCTKTLTTAIPIVTKHHCLFMRIMRWKSKEISFPSHINAVYKKLLSCWIGLVSVIHMCVRIRLTKQSLKGIKIWFPNFDHVDWSGENVFNCVCIVNCTDEICLGFGAWLILFDTDWVLLRVLSIQYMNKDETIWYINNGSKQSANSNSSSKQ